MKIIAIQRWQLLLFLLFIGTITTAQETPSTSTTIINQFDHILTQSESYRDLQIVKRKWIENLKESVTHSYSNLEAQLTDSKAMVQQQKSEIENLKTKLEQTNASLSKYTNAGPTVIFLGIEFNQFVFGTLFSILFFGSLILTCIFAIKYNKSNELTLNAKSVLVELEEEYQEYKRKTIEREQKISRQLQDEINKQKHFIQMKVS
ncbi:hypothetical protein EQG63_03465 [Flavobacterium amnicola]|uniref:tRNA (Guanine-N1)-methyltransferase n=1 Tax=Flavobacterium amnicola TaxID=2506422 RepID=A0A4Q1K5E2_9FLAO|nr:hypothetical protein [Flavobacterium amnicola]RXR21008.1 hypothetical protein EQG63_03465 [Flavobacterium amnicola]